MPVDVTPGASEPVRVELKAVAHGFRRGHRLRSP